MEFRMKVVDPKIVLDRYEYIATNHPNVFCDPTENTVCVVLGDKAIELSLPWDVLETKEIHDLWTEVKIRQIHGTGVYIRSGLNTVFDGALFE